MKFKSGTGQQSGKYYERYDCASGVCDSEWGTSR